MGRTGALHFFFLGWALPIALAGLLVYVRNLPGMFVGTFEEMERPGTGELLPNGEIPTGPSGVTVALWNIAVLAVGLGFFFLDQQFATYLHAIGWPIIIVLWASQLGKIVVGRGRLRSESTQVQT